MALIIVRHDHVSIFHQQLEQGHHWLMAGVGLVMSRLHERVVRTLSWELGAEGPILD